VADFEAWVKQGAPDPRTGAVAVVSALDGLMQKAKPHWGLSAVKPLEKGDGRNVIDALQPAKSPPGDARTLARRAYLALIGLPPTPEQLDAFVTATGQDPARAFDRLIDELLASPGYGERWGRHWLDCRPLRRQHGSHLQWRRHLPLRLHLSRLGHRGFNHDEPYDRFILDQHRGGSAAGLHPEDNRRSPRSVS